MFIFDVPSICTDSDCLNLWDLVRDFSCDLFFFFFFFSLSDRAICHKVEDNSVKLFLFSCCGIKKSAM